MQQNKINKNNSVPMTEKSIEKSTSVVDLLKLKNKNEPENFPKGVEPCAQKGATPEDVKHGTSSSMIVTDDEVKNKFDKIFEEKISKLIVQTGLPVIKSKQKAAKKELKNTRVISSKLNTQIRDKQREFKNLRSYQSQALHEKFPGKYPKSNPDTSGPKSEYEVPGVMGKIASWIGPVSVNAQPSPDCMDDFKKLMQEIVGEVNACTGEKLDIFFNKMSESKEELFSKDIPGVTEQVSNQLMTKVPIVLVASGLTVMYVNGNLNLDIKKILGALVSMTGVWYSSEILQWFKGANELFEPQSLNESDYLEDYKTIIGTFIGYFTKLTTGKLPDMKKMVSIMKIIIDIPRACTSLIEIWHWIEKTVYSILNWINTVVCKKPTLKSFRSHGETIDIWMDKAHEVLNESCTGQLKISGANFVRIDKIIKDGSKLQRDMVDKRSALDKTALNVIGTLLTALRKAIEPFSYMGKANRGLRMRPIGLALRGISGVGKSKNTIPLISRVMEKVEKYEGRKSTTLDNYRDKIFFKTAGDEWYEGYIPEEHEVFVRDDAFAVRPAYDKTTTPEGVQVMREINEVPYLLKMANANAKGHSYFNSWLVVLSTNKSDKKIEQQIQDSPVWNRIDFDCFVYPKKEYSSNPTAPPDQRVLNPEHPIFRDNDGSFIEDVVEYHCRPGSSDGVHTIFNMDQLVNLIFKKYVENRNKFENFLQSMQFPVNNTGVNLENVYTAQSLTDPVDGDVEEDEEILRIEKEVNEEMHTFESINDLFPIRNSFPTHYLSTPRHFEYFDKLIKSGQLKTLYNKFVKKFADTQNDDAVLRENLANFGLYQQIFGPWDVTVTKVCKLQQLLDYALREHGLSDCEQDTTVPGGFSYYHYVDTNVLFWVQFLFELYPEGVNDILGFEPDYKYGTALNQLEPPFIGMETFVLNFAQFLRTGVFDSLSECKVYMPTFRFHNIYRYAMNSIKMYIAQVSLTTKKIIGSTKSYPLLNRVNELWVNISRKAPFIVYVFDLILAAYGVKLAYKGAKQLISTTKNYYFDNKSIPEIENFVETDKKEKVKKDKVEVSKLQPQLSGEKPRSIKTKTYTTTVGRFEPQGKRDTNSDQMLGTIIKNNWYHALSPWTGRKMFSILFIKERLFVCPLHYKTMIEILIKDEIEEGDNYVFNFKNLYTQKSFMCSPQDFLVNFVPYDEEKRIDLAFGTLDIGFETRDITSYFIPEKIHENDPDMHISIPRYNDENMRGIYYAPGSYRGDCEYADKYYNQVKVLKGIGYQVPTVQGDCGAPVMAVNTAINGAKVIGMHVAGHCGNAGLALIITQEMIEEILNRSGSKERYNDFDIEALCEAFDANLASQAVLNGIEGNFKFVRKVSDCPYMPYMTKIEKSPLYNEVVPSLKGPAQRYVCGEDLRIRALSEYGIPDPRLSKQSIDKIWHGLFQEITLRSNVKSFRHTRIYKMKDACQGIESLECFKPITRKTSPGYPYINHKVPGLSGKKAWFSDFENFQFTSKLWLSLEKDILALRDDYANPDFERKTEVIFMDVDKDELLPLDKINSGKLRMFSATPLHYLIICRMYFMGFVMWLIENRIHNHFAVGINVYSTDWNVLAFELLRHKRMIAADYSKFDKNQIASALMRLCHYINNWYNDHETNKIIRIGIFKDLVYSLHIFEGTIYQWQHGLPSGHFLTIIVNCFMCIFYLSYTWREVVPEPMLEHFYDQTWVIAGGDDHIISVSEIASEFFNFETIRDFLPNLNQKYTPESKDLSTYKTKTIDEVTFYKRAFIKHPKIPRYIAPLSLETVLEMFQWTKSSMFREKIVRDNVKQAILELSLHPKEIWEKYSGKIFLKSAELIQYDISYYTQEIARDECLALDSFH